MWTFYPANIVMNLVIERWEGADIYVFVRLRSGRDLPVRADGNTTMQELRDRVHIATAVAVDGLWTQAGQLVADDLTVAQLGLQTGDRLLVGARTQVARPKRCLR